MGISVSYSSITISQGQITIGATTTAPTPTGTRIMTIDKAQAAHSGSIAIARQL